MIFISMQEKNQNKVEMLYELGAKDNWTSSIDNFSVWFKKIDYDKYEYKIVPYKILARALY